MTSLVASARSPAPGEAPRGRRLRPSRAAPLLMEAAAASLPAEAAVASWTLPQGHAQATSPACLTALAYGRPCHGGTVPTTPPSSGDSPHGGPFARATGPAGQ